MKELVNIKVYRVDFFIYLFINFVISSVIPVFDRPRVQMIRTFDSEVDRRTLLKFQPILCSISSGASRDERHDDVAAVGGHAEVDGTRDQLHFHQQQKRRV